MFNVTVDCSLEKLSPRKTVLLSNNLGITKKYSIHICLPHSKLVEGLPFFTLTCSE